jgi:hypothetical protein
MNTQLIGYEYTITYDDYKMNKCVMNSMKKLNITTEINQ